MPPADEPLWFATPDPADPVKVKLADAPGSPVRRAGPPVRLEPEASAQVPS